MLLAYSFCAVSVSAAEREKLHLPEPAKKVDVRKRAGYISYRKIPSPGNNYDELAYNVKIGGTEQAFYLQSSLLMTPERDDRITVPYVRLLTTSGVEFAMATYSNAMFWSEGDIYAISKRLPMLPRKYYVACGYAYYFDSMYPHMQGGPQETIVESSTGRIIHRGEPWNRDEYKVDISDDSGLIFLGDTIHARVVRTAGTNITGAAMPVNLDYMLFDVKSGQQVVKRENVHEVVLRPKQSGNYLLSMSVGHNNMVYWREVRMITVLPKLEWTDNPDYLGRLIVNDSIGCGLDEDIHHLQDGRTVKSLGTEEITTRLAGSDTTNIFGGKGRVIIHDKGFFAYTLGINLTLNMPYILEIEYPEDQPRTMAFLISNGTYAPGIHTGHTLGQPEPRYFAEQVMFPISGSRHKMRFLVWAGDHEIRNGFFVGVADPGRQNAPFSRKPLLLRMTLYNMLSIACPRIRTGFPADIQRYAWSESEDIIPLDQVRFSPHLNSLFYGMNSLCPAMLSWNAHGDINNSIMFRSSQYRKPVRKFIKGIEYETDRYESISNRYDFAGEYLLWAKKLKLNVFPRFEYGGSDLLPQDTAAIREDGYPYPAVMRPSTGTIIKDSVDICNPAVEKDIDMLIREFCSNLTDEDKRTLRQPVIRRRGHFLSTSYSSYALEQFEKDTGVTLKGDTVEARRKDAVSNYLDRYRRWYQVRLFTFLEKIYNTYWTNVDQTPSPLLYYHWQNPGMPYEGVYYRNRHDWEQEKRIRTLPFEGFPLPDISKKKLVDAVPQWTSMEEGLLMDAIQANVILPVAPVYGKNAASSASYFDLFRHNGKLAVKITPSVHSTTRIYRKGFRTYFAGLTMYHSRQYSMYEPVLTFATATPDYMMFEQAHAPCFPFPEYSRRFFMNYLTLPAVPFKDISGEQALPVKVLMGTYAGKTYVAVMNTGFRPIRTVKVSVPVTDVDFVRPLVGKTESIALYVSSKGISFNVELDAIELRSFLIE
jgi:hypothetical protein